MMIAVVGNVEPVAADEVMKKRRIDKKQGKRTDPCTQPAQHISETELVIYSID